MPPGPMSSVCASIILPVRRCSVHSSAISVRQVRRRSLVTPTIRKYASDGLLRTRYSRPRPAAARPVQGVRRAAADRLGLDRRARRRGQPGAVQLLQRRLRPSADADVLERRAEGLGDVRGLRRRVRLEPADLRPARGDERRPPRRCRAGRTSSRSPGWRWRRRGSSRRRGWPPRRSRSSAGSSDGSSCATSTARRANIVIFGQVVGVHVDERHIVDGRFDTAGVQADRPLRLPRRLRRRHRAVRDAQAVTKAAPETGPLADRVRCCLDSA